MDRQTELIRLRDALATKDGQLILAEFVARAKEYEKQLKAYREAEEASKAEREAEAKRAGFSDDASRQFVFEVKNREFMQYVRALEALDGEAKAKAAAALSRYQYTVNPKDLETAQAAANAYFVINEF